MHDATSYGYVPALEFRNLNHAYHLRDWVFPPTAGWRKEPADFFAVLNNLTHRIFSQFRINGAGARPSKDKNGKELWFNEGLGFGTGTVHHAACTLRMPFKWMYNGNREPNCVVDENLHIEGTDNLYVCDMSVMPFSSAANPVRTLVALALRLSRHLN